jgi:Na+-transporting methylmalonyl-CoA/oxaloacetate decarboxylase gamma subunit
MSENLIIALQITLVGMGLVFAAILLLWGIMALLVRLTARSVEAEAEQERAALTELERKQRAAAAAVAVALAQVAEASEPHEFPLPPTALVSAWQAVMRTRILNKRGPTR